MAAGHPKGELYFIAVVPPPPVFEEALEVKHRFSREYGTKAALKSPPHITLHMPFRMKEEREDELIRKLRGSLEGVSPFRLELDGFGAFPPRVIYIHANLSEELRELYHRVRRRMQQFLHTDASDWKNRGFTPHLTVAFRDLKKARFKEAWEKYGGKPFDASWEVTGIHLLRHNGKNWDVLKEISFY